MSTATLTAKANVSSSKLETNNPGNIENFSNTIWQITYNLRDFVNQPRYVRDLSAYVLNLFIYRFLSENLIYCLNYNVNKNIATYPREIWHKFLFPEVIRQIKKLGYFDYTKLTDQIDRSWRFFGMIDRRGFFIYPSELFCNVLNKSEKDTNLDKRLVRIFCFIDACVFTYMSWRCRTYGGVPTLLFQFTFEDFLSLGSKAKERNKKIVEIMKAVSEIPLDDFIKDNAEVTIEKVIKWRQELFSKVRDKCFDWQCSIDI